MYIVHFVVCPQSRSSVRKKIKWKMEKLFTIVSSNLLFAIKFNLVLCEETIFILIYIWNFKGSGSGISQSKRTYTHTHSVFRLCWALVTCNLSFISDFKQIDIERYVVLSSSSSFCITSMSGICENVEVRRSSPCSTNLKMPSRLIYS